MEQASPRLKKLIIEVVENQIRDNNPPATSQTLSRLISAGYSRTKAKEMIAAVVAEQIFDIMHDNKPFDEENYVKALNKIH